MGKTSHWLKNSQCDVGEELENTVLKTEGPRFLKGIANKIMDGSCFINFLTSLLLNWYKPEVSPTQPLRILGQDLAHFPQGGTCSSEHPSLPPLFSLSQFSTPL